jgi:hypothetical protein
MNLSIKSPISTFACILVAIIVLVGYFFNLGSISLLRDLLLNWAIILAGVALMVGVINLVRMHLRKVENKAKGSLNSIVLVCSFFLTLAIAGYFGLASDWSQWIYNSILVPIETSLIAILAIFLILTLPKMLKRRMGMESVFFIAVILFILLGYISIFGEYIPAIFGDNGLYRSIINLVAISGIRGLLIGIALGAIATGIRVIIGSDRPYGG